MTEIKEWFWQRNTSDTHDFNALKKHIKAKKTPLTQAIEDYNGDLFPIQELIQKGEDVNEPDDFNHTPLIKACILRNLDIVRLLLKNGADVNGYGTETTKETPIFFATHPNANINVLEELIRHGADVNQRNTHGQTPLFATVAHNNDPKFTKTLIDNGADVNVQDDLGYTPLLFAAVWSPYPDNVRLLLDAGADKEAKTFHNQSLTTLAQSNKNKKVTEMLTAGEQLDFDLTSPKIESLLSEENLTRYNNFMKTPLQEVDDPADFAQGSPIMPIEPGITPTTQAANVDVDIPDSDPLSTPPTNTPANFGDINISTGGYTPDTDDAPLISPTAPEFKIVDVLEDSDNPENIKVKVQNLDTGDTEERDLSDVDI